MKKLFGAVIVCALLVAALSCLAEPAKGVTFSSEKPRYAKVALTENGSKILCVVFDESKGTGKGCDVLYADTNFNGVFEGGEKLTPTIEKCSMGFHCNFPAIKLDVPYNQKAKGIPNPCEVSLNYAWHSSPLTPRTTILGVTLSGPAPKTVTENFYGSVTVRLPGESQQQWEYSSNPSDLNPAESLEKAPLMGLAGTPKLMIATQPDGRNEGNFGVALTVVSVRRAASTGDSVQSEAKEPASCVDLGLTEAEIPMQVKVGASAPKAHVEIKTPDGKVVHKGDETLDKFVFG
jgi:hypothetical protein